MLFALMLTAMVLMAALVVDGGAAVVRQRQLQNAADAAALTASHDFGMIGCADAGGPRPQVVATARRTVRAHLPGVADARIVISCPSGYQNFAVEVAVSDHAQATFIRLVAAEGILTGARAVGVNRPLGTTIRHSVLALNEGNPGWDSNSGCPAVRLTGNSRLDVFASFHVNSACRSVDGNAMVTEGNPSLVTVRNGTFTVVGDATGNFDPTPDAGDPVADPFAGLAPPSRAGLPVRATNRLSVGSARILEPGYYRGGWDISSTALLRPGVYYIDGGGITVRGRGELYSVDATATSTDSASWDEDCTVGACGVLIYNTGAGALGAIDASGSQQIKLRGYSPAADVLGLNLQPYSGLAIWQDALPRPQSRRSQPQMLLRGSNSLELYGIVYLPSARLTLVGSSDGTASDANLAAAFVVYELMLEGSAYLTLRYDDSAFPQLYDYGLAR